MCHPPLHHFKKKTWHEVKVLRISIGFQILRALNERPSTSLTPKCKFTRFWKPTVFQKIQWNFGYFSGKYRVLTRLRIGQSSTKICRIFSTKFSSTDPPAFKQWFFVGTSNFMGLSRGSNVGSGCVVLLHVFLMMTGVFSMVEPDMGPKACPNQSYKWIFSINPRKNPFVLKAIYRGYNAIHNW